MQLWQVHIGSGAEVPVADLAFEISVTDDDRLQVGAVSRLLAVDSKAVGVPPVRVHVGIVY